MAAPLRGKKTLGDSVLWSFIAGMDRWLKPSEVDSFSLLVAALKNKPPFAGFYMFLLYIFGTTLSKCCQAHLSRHQEQRVGPEA
jgi:hypothetical protein